MTVTSMPRKGSLTIRGQGGGPRELYLYDVIGSSFFGGISSKDVVEQLSALVASGSPDLAVRINSPGGEVFEGLAIYNALIRYRARVDVYIDGAAWSIASVIAMAGETVTMASNAQFMIHDPAAFVFGVSDELRKVANLLDENKESVITAYQRHTNAGRERLANWMTEETWFSAQEAQAAGFVEEIEEALPVAAWCPPSMRFHNMPAGVQKGLRSDKERGRVDMRAAMLYRSQQRLEQVLKGR